MTILEREHMPKVDASAVQCPAGFVAGGMACGIKASGAPDLALIVAEQPVAAAGMFTRNLVRAAPVEISSEHLRANRGRAKAILISSGCANAATGAEGRRRAQRTVDELASLLKCDQNDVLVNSTGVIGVQLPDDKIIAAMPKLAKRLSRDGLKDAMSAIMTTDTRPKMIEIGREHRGRTMRVVGIAKGAGMIHPNMATMIAVLLTDAKVDSSSLDGMLRRAVDKSFHRISIDGDTSTNDSVFVLASGAAGEFPAAMVEDAITEAARELAIMVVRDGEGAQKLIHIHVRKARTQAEALQVAQTVAGSLLVRTAVTGGDPNWGRILAAAGRSGVAIDPQRIAISANAVALFVNGAPADSKLSDRQHAFQAETVRIDIDLGQGDASDEFFTCDLTEGYVQVNSHYMT